MNRPIFPRIPEARRRAQERAAVRACAPVEKPAMQPKPAVAPASARDPALPLPRSQGTSDTSLDAGAADDGGTS